MNKDENPNWGKTDMDFVRKVVLEYAKNTAIDFAEYLESEGWQQYDGRERWINLKMGDIVKTTSELFNEYLKSKQ